MGKRKGPSGNRKHVKFDEDGEPEVTVRDTIDVIEKQANEYTEEEEEEKCKRRKTMNNKLGENEVDTTKEFTKNISELKENVEGIQEQGLRKIIHNNGDNDTISDSAPIQSQQSHVDQSKNTITNQINSHEGLESLPENDPEMYGNYNKYYLGRRSAGDDQRIKVLRRAWFEGKKCLDVGCNSGVFTIEIARNFQPKKILGTDIDENLIKLAKNTVERFKPVTMEADNGPAIQFPMSFGLTMGRLKLPQAKEKKKQQHGFPFNVEFKAANILDDTVTGTYDVITCLSVTKWIHLNWGDEGIRQLFEKFCRCIRPGGLLILEPQARHTYKKRKLMTATIYNNYHTICIHPDQFQQMLCSGTGGFDFVEKVDVPEHPTK
eukprot:Ihof_evm7s104 gene=Ihof_evmTU7s104